jgi:hypothetical protein
MSQSAARSPAIEEMMACGPRFGWWKRRVKKNGKVAKVPFTPDGWSGRLEHPFPGR